MNYVALQLPPPLPHTVTFDMLEAACADSLPLFIFVVPA